MPKHLLTLDPFLLMPEKKLWELHRHNLELWETYRLDLGLIRAQQRLPRLVEM